jgi:hypothetical protein
VPSLWKDSYISPIPKVQSVTSEDELRPIALTPCLSKLLEDFVVRWMMSDFSASIDPQQFGCLKGSSTTYCLLDMLHNWLLALDTPSQFLRVCFLDFSKAFDRINYNLLVPKLLHLGVRKSLIPWICNFLFNRRQAVKLGFVMSRWAHTHAGVPQGTKLGPILFLLMVNDLVTNSPLHSYHWKYVDDISLYEVVPRSENSRLQSYLNTTSNWSFSNDMRLNPKKSKELVISFLHNQSPLCPLVISDQPVERVTSYKMLGIVFQQDLKWHSHVDSMVKKASKRLHILRVLRHSGVPPFYLLNIYSALIRSILEYYCPVWHPGLPVYLSDNIESIQKRAFRILFPNNSYSQALKFSDFPGLPVRRNLINNNNNFLFTP